MKIRILHCTVGGFLIAAMASAAVTWPTYENMDRKMGRVSELFTTAACSSPGGCIPWVAFVLTLPDGSPVRFDCGLRAVSLGCDHVQMGQTLLVSGHTESYGGGTSCRWDGADYLLVPNAIYDCSAWQASGGSVPCVLLTP